MGMGLVISARLDPEQSSAFVEFCDRRGLNKSDFVRHLIAEALRKDDYLTRAFGPEYEGKFTVMFNPTDTEDPI